MIKIDLDFFEKVIFLNCLKKDTPFLASCIEYLDEELFKDKNIGAIIGIIKEFYLINDVTPTNTELRARVVSTQQKEKLELAVKAIRGLDVDFAEEELIRNTEHFIRQRNLEKLLERAIDERVKDKQVDMDEFQKESEKIHTISLIDNLGLDYFGDSERVIEYLGEKQNTFSSGYTGFDQAIGGGFFEEGKQFGCIGGETNVGKAQPVSLQLMTPDGMRRFGDLKVGDRVFGKNGQPVTITHIHPQGLKKIYNVKFVEGRETWCCAEHLWDVWDRDRTVYSTIDTQTMFDLVENHHHIIHIPLCDPVEFDPYGYRPLIIPPYIFGVMLMTGRALSQSERDAIADKGVAHDVIDAELSRIFLADDFSTIPDEYKYSSVESRCLFLSGLMDSVGVHVQISTSPIKIILSGSRRVLAPEIRSIIHSLGGKAYKMVPSDSKDIEIFFRLPDHLYTLLNVCAECDHTRDVPEHFTYNKGPLSVLVKSVIPMPDEVECMCITVDAPDSLYLTNDYIVTHNSIVLANIVCNVLVQDKNVLIYTMEMSEMRYAKRISSILTGIALSLLDTEIDNLREYIEDFKEKYRSRLIIKEFPTKGASAKTLLAHSGLLKRRKSFEPNLIAFDYHALLRPSVNQLSKHSEIQYITQECRGLTYNIGAPGISVAQLNRTSHKVESPGLNTISGSWDSIADEDFHANIWQTDEDREASLLRYIGAKARDGDKGHTGFWTVDYDTLRLHEARDNSTIADIDKLASGDHLGFSLDDL